MPPLFEHLEYIESLLTASPLGLMTDIDGTISFAAPTPDEAHVTPTCRNSLNILSGHLRLVAAISGRPIDQMRRMVGLDSITYVGNHGFERWVGGRVEPLREAIKYSAIIDAALQEVKSLMAGGDIFFENKGTTASIHYRLCRDHKVARKQIFAALESSPAAMSLRIKPGRIAVDLLPSIEVNKGTAVRDLIGEYRLRSAIYLGDDVSDIDAFKAIHESRSPGFDGISLAVVNEETLPGVEDEADFTLRGVGEVEYFLKWLTGVLCLE